MTSPNLIEHGAMIAIKTPSGEHLAVRKMDWDRVKRHVSQFKRTYDWYVFAYSTAFGVAGNGVFAVVALWNATGLSPWIFPSMVIVTLASIVVGLLFLILHVLGNRVGRDLAAEIKADMDDIERLCAPPGDNDPH